MNEALAKVGREENESSDFSNDSRSSSRSEKFMRSLSIPLNSATSKTSPPSPSSTIPKNRSFLSLRSNSILGSIFSTENDLSIGKRIKKRISPKNSAQLPPPVSLLTRTRSNSLRRSLDSPSNTSPIFNTSSFSDITDDYFKYDTKKRNRSITSHTDSVRSNGIYDRDPLDSGPPNFEETDSVYSSVSLNHELTLEQIIRKNSQSLSASSNNIDGEDVKDAEEEEEELAQSMAFDILERIKEISLIEENEEKEEAYSI